MTEDLERHDHSAKTQISLEHAQTEVTKFVDYYNHARLHSVDGFIPSVDKLARREEVFWKARDQKLE